MDTSPYGRTIKTSPNETKLVVKTKEHPSLRYWTMNLLFFPARATLADVVHVYFVMWKKESKERLTCICLYMSKV